MAKKSETLQVVEKAVADLWQTQGDELRQAIVREVLAAVEPLLAAGDKRTSDAGDKSSSGGSPTDLLNAAVNSIYDNSGQADILKALLDGVSQFAARAALFVMKGGKISAWQSRGFEKASAFKGLSLDASSGLAGRAIEDRESVSAAAAEFDSGFIKTHGNPVDGNAVVSPLVVRDKVAAVLYTDAGTDSAKFDGSAVQMLVRSASSWLELISLRKAVGESASGEASAEAPAQAREQAQEEAPPPPPPPAASAKDDRSNIPAEDAEVHKKAKRFAKLLVDEIKLYNQAKVTEGRKNKDIYSRLKEDIDKSRATYDKRYGSTAAASGGYFAAEVVRILADNDPSMLGGGFQQ